MEHVRTKRKFTTTTVGVIGVSVKEGQQKTGVEKSPSQFRDAKLLNVISEIGLQVKDYGDITRDSISTEVEAAFADTKAHKFQVLNGEVLGCMNQKLSDMCYESAMNKETVLILGGDHGLATGSISGVKRAYPKLKVIWFDAHGDCNTPETSPSGNYHGMPAAHLMGWVPEGSIRGFDWFKPCLEDTEIVYIGLRDIDPEERNLLRKHNIKVFTPYDIEMKGGIANVMTETLAYLEADNDQDTPIHVSWDVDGCDPSFITATGTRARCGLSERESHFILKRIAATGNLVSLDMVEVNPELEEDKDAIREVLHGDIPKLRGTPTLVYACEFVLSALGHVWL